MEGWVGGTGAADAVNQEREVVIKSLSMPQAGSELQTLKDWADACV